MCGPSKQENAAQASQSSLSSTLQADFNSRFAGQGAILNNLNSLWTPIAQAGPDQQGFGANELAALRTGAHEGVGANYAKASQALNTNLAARGGGNEFLPTGAGAALKGNLASAAANAMSQADLGITQANYAQGRNNWAQATAGLNALASQYNPTGFAGEASSANQASFSMAKQINQERNQKWADIAGGVTGLLGAIPGIGTGISAGLSFLKGAAGSHGGGGNAGGSDDFYGGES